MAASTEPRSGLFHTWDLGEDGWNVGMDANLLSIGRYAYHLSVKDRDLATPPVSPVDGDSYIVAATATGDWTGEENKIAVWDATGAAWVFGTPRLGYHAFIEDEGLFQYYDGAGWSSYAGSFTTLNASGNATFSGQANGAGFVATGGFSALSANAAVMDNQGSGVSRLLALGPDAGTVGTWELRGATSTAASNTLIMSTDTSGNATFSGSIALLRPDALTSSEISMQGGGVGGLAFNNLNSDGFEFKYAGVDVFALAPTTGNATFNNTATIQGQSVAAASGNSDSLTISNQSDGGTNLNFTNGIGTLGRLRFNVAGTGAGTDDGVFVVDVSTNGVPDAKLIITDTGDATFSGNVGVGSASITRQLNVGGSTGSFKIQGSSNGGYIELVGPSNTNYIGTPAAISSGSTTDLAFYTSSLLALTLDSSQNATFNGTVTSKVLDGTDSFHAGGTTVGLRVNHTALRTAIEGVDSSTFSSSYQPIELTGSTVALTIAGTPALSIDASGDSTFSGAVKTAGLQVTGTTVDATAGSAFEAISAADIVYAAAIDRGGALYRELRHTASSFDWATTPNTGTSRTIRMTLDANGNLLVGQTSGGNRLMVTEDTNGSDVAVFTHSGASIPSGISVDLSAASPDNNSQYMFAAQDSTANRVFIYSDGDVWTSDAGILTSDEQLKTNIQDATPKLSDVMSLRVRNFEWIPEYHPNKVGEKKIGFIAQEFEQTFPGLVGENTFTLNDEEVTRKSVRMGALVPILVKAMQEQQAIIDALTARIEALEAQ